MIAPKLFLKVSRGIIVKKILLVLLLGLALALPAGGGAAAEESPVDYAALVSPDFSSETVKTEAAVHIFVDGDTTHFSVSDPAFPSGVLKARYLGINTPECTGKIEPYGKQASEFTRARLSGAVRIVIESDDAK